MVLHGNLLKGLGESATWHSRLDSKKLIEAKLHELLDGLLCISYCITTPQELVLKAPPQKDKNDGKNGF